MLKKVAIFWVDKFRVVIFLGIQYEPLSDSPPPPPAPPVIKICEWGPWDEVARTCWKDGQLASPYAVTLLTVVRGQTQSI